MPPIVVLGSNSFSGASFCRHLLAQGLKVIGISRSTPPDTVFLPYLWQDYRHLFEFYAYDLNHHLTEIMALFDKQQPAYIYNFAAQSMVAESWVHPEHWFQTNVVATINLHQQLKDRAYLQRYIHISTPEVYGSCQGYVQPHRHYAPSTPYAVSRAAADLSLHTFFESYHFPVVFTRAANVYGPGQALYRLIPKVLLSAYLKQQFPLHGGGYSERSFIHIDDVCRATQLIGEQGQLGEIYHIATESSVQIRQLVTTIAAAFGLSLEEICTITEERRGKDSAYLLDSSQLRQLGWHDQISLTQGIETTKAWVQKHAKQLAQLPQHYQHQP